jgi:uncharacterized membrane protein
VIIGITSGPCLKCSGFLLSGLVKILSPAIPVAQYRNKAVEILVVINELFTPQKLMLDQYDMKII